MKKSRMLSLSLAFVLVLSMVVRVNALAVSSAEETIKRITEEAAGVKNNSIKDSAKDLKVQQRSSFFQNDELTLKEFSDKFTEFCDLWGVSWNKMNMLGYTTIENINVTNLDEVIITVNTDKKEHVVKSVSIVLNGKKEAETVMVRMAALAASIEHDIPQTIKESSTLLEKIIEELDYGVSWLNVMKNNSDYGDELLAMWYGDHDYFWQRLDDYYLLTVKL